jgi:sRNA-binding regulator protein Hfq
MAGGVNTPRWDKGPQHRQGQPNQQSRQQRTQQRRPNDYGGFDGSILGTNCMFKLANGEIVQGLVVAASRYWYMLNVDGQVVIVNKGYVVTITPVQSQNNNQQNRIADALVGAMGGNYGGKKQ